MLIRIIILTNKIESVPDLIHLDIIAVILWKSRNGGVKDAGKNRF